MTSQPPDTLRQTVLAALPVLAGQPWLSLRGGRTNRLWKVGDTVVKTHDATAASPLFPNDPQAEARALREAGPLGLAPQLLAEGPDWIAYTHVAADPGHADPAEVARTLHRVHQHPGRGHRALPSGSVALRAQTTAILAQCRETLPPPPPAADQPPAPRACLVHGDAVPGNILATAGGPLLIDWQCPAQGDPVEDLSTYLSPAMQWLYRGRILTPGERQRFLEAYPDRATVARFHALAPLLHWRMAAHCLWKAERGADDYRSALRLELG